LALNEYIDILRRSNPGVLIEERDFSIFNVTGFFNRLFLVVGSSEKGPFNIPVVVVSPENFEEIFGKQDLKMERKGSYFHRTVKNLLKEGPVICVNLRPIDENLDKYNWITLSTSSDTFNSQKRSTSVDKFFNRSDGFWRRSKENLLKTSLENIPDANLKPLTFVNTGEKPISILTFRSRTSGFDIPAEDWYDGKVPTHIHPKDRISDYMLEVAVVQGRWDNYDELSKHPRWSQYFNKSGLRTNRIDDFFNDTSVEVLKRWQTSLIPYFKDNNDKDMFIESVINDDVNETGVFVSYNTDVVESDVRNGLVDILGDNLTTHKRRNFDFLSYKRFITDFFIIDERLIDHPGNVVGNHLTNLGLGRTMYFAEAYAHNVKLKPFIISTTTSIEVKPFDAGDDAYVVINGKKIDINSDISEFLALHEIVSPGFHTPYVILATENGIEFRSGIQRPLNEDLTLPTIDAKIEIVLGYYEISQSLAGAYSTKLHGVILDDNGFVNPFRTGAETGSRIRFLETDYQWINQIYFEDIFNPDPQNYNQLRLWHIWYYLSENLVENDSLTLDTQGNKQLIDWIEPGNDGNSRWLKVAIKDKAYDIRSASGTNGANGYYFKDVEFLPQEEIMWEEQIEPFLTGDGGIIGDDSFIKESYLRGDINSGDPFFWSFSEETNVRFVKDIQNMIVIPEGPFVDDYIGRKVIVNGSEENDGVFTLLNIVDYNGDPAIVVQEEVIEEEVDILSFYDAELPQIVNLYEIGNSLKAKVESYDGEPQEVYQRLEEEKQDAAQWVKTLEIEQVVDKTKVLVKWDRYVAELEKGYFLLADNTKKNVSHDGCDIDNENERVRNWTRIIDLVRDDNNPEYLLVETDYPIYWRSFDGDLQTDCLIPIHMWVDTLDFKVLEPYIVRKESLPDGTEERQNQILDLIAPNTKMQQALVTDNIEWRYLVDSFGLGMSTNSKYQLANLVEQKQLAFGFLNMPSVKQFRKLGDTYTTDRRFDTQKLLAGGDRKNTGSTRFTLSDVGQSHVTYLTPYVAVREDGRFNLVPPSPYVGELYMRKFNTSSLKNWDIMAGVRNGRVPSINGLELIYNQDELKDLNQYNVTPITAFNNTIWYLYNEATAVGYSSSLRFIHVREALIELESSLKEELQFFQWKFFGDKLTQDITEKANEICDQYKRDNAIAAFFNEFEATPEMIDAQIGVIKTYVEPVLGMGTIILTTNVFGTGAIGDIFG
jgi:hypothetical protein